MTVRPLLPALLLASAAIAFAAAGQPQRRAAQAGPAARVVVLAPAAGDEAEQRATGNFALTLSEALRSGGVELLLTRDPQPGDAGPRNVFDELGVPDDMRTPELLARWSGAEALITVRATAGQPPRIYYSPEGDSPAASLEMARSIQSALPGAELVECPECAVEGAAGVVVDLGDTAAQPATQLTGALAVRGALKPFGGAERQAAVPAQITTPTPGSTLSGPTVTFQWSAGQEVTGYWLMAGTWLGGNTLYDGYQGLLTSANLTGLPTDGRTIYIRLWSYINNQWVSTDTTFKAFSSGGATPAKAAITAPAPGSTLSGASVAFQWNAGTAVSRYYLFAGLWTGGNSIFSQDMGTTQSATVTGLPTDGSTVYMRLWSYIDGVWQFNDHTYTAAGTTTPVKAAITSPAAGSTLPGASATFNWNAGTAVSRYFLHVGAWQGGNTLFSQDMGTSLSATAGGLPTDGSTVYVRLWSYIKGSWDYADYTFKAAGAPPVPAKADLTAPTPGSTLPGSSASFSWTKGSGVQRYWLFIGTVVGNNDVYGADQGTNLAVTVGSLPVNGKQLYVRLWSYIAGAWLFNDYAFKAAGQ